MKHVGVVVVLVLFLALASCAEPELGLEIAGEWLTNTDSGAYHQVFADGLGFVEIPYTQSAGGFDIVSFDNETRTLIAFYYSHPLDELKGKFAKIMWTDPSSDETTLTTYAPAGTAADAEASTTEFSESLYTKQAVADIGTTANPLNMSAFYADSSVLMHGAIPKGKRLYMICLTPFALNSHTFVLSYQSEDIDMFTYSDAFTTIQEESIENGTGVETISGNSDANMYLHYMIDGLPMYYDWAYFVLEAGT